jgi:DNA-binding response OmpR family regulator
MTKPLAFIIEDDPLLGEIYSLTLQPEFNTETFLDGDVALVRLGQAVPAIVVLDLNLPTIAGKDVLKQIRLDKRLAGTKVIIASADSNQAALLSDQADIIMLKPVSTTQLRELAARLLQN